MAKTDTAQEFLDMQKKVEAAQTRVDKASGALEQTMSALKTKFKCSTVEAGKKKLAKLKKETTKAEETYEDMKGAFEQEWTGEDEDE